MMAPIAPIAPPGIAPKSIADRRSAVAESIVTAQLETALTTGTPSPSGCAMDESHVESAEVSGSIKSMVSVRTDGACD